MALEDSQRRLQSRLQMIEKECIPDNLFFVTKAQMMGEGFEVQLEQWLSAEPGPAMVIIDTFQKVRGISAKGVNAYQDDYQVVSALKRIADQYRAAIVCIHHTNKLRNVNDPYQTR